MMEDWPLSWTMEATSCSMDHTSSPLTPPCSMDQKPHCSVAQASWKNDVKTRNHKGPWHGKTQTYERKKQKIGVVNGGGSIVAAYAKKHSSTSSTIFSHGPSNSTRIKHSYSWVVLSTHFIHTQRFFGSSRSWDTTSDHKCGKKRIAKAAMKCDHSRGVRKSDLLE